MELTGGHLAKVDAQGNEVWQIEITEDKYNVDGLGWESELTFKGDQRSSIIRILPSKK